MRSIAVLLALASLAVAPGARAHTIGVENGGEHEYSGAVPCAVVCSYWIDNGFSPCETPFPPGSYLDQLTNPAPAPPLKIIVLEVTFDPELDWDMFLCSSRPPHYEYPQNYFLGEPCDNRLRPNNFLPIGCHEDLSVPVVAGQTVIMRAYNWSDPLPAIGRWHYLFA